ncbi:MAG: hypothetical protein RL077_2476 [Verrucomicrobiota bacterium]
MVNHRDPSGKAGHAWHPPAAATPVPHLAASRPAKTHGQGARSLKKMTVFRGGSSHQRPSAAPPSGQPSASSQRTPCDFELNAPLIFQLASLLMQKFLLVCLFALSFTRPTAAATAQTRPSNPNRPNLIFILADDWGWGDLGSHGHPWLMSARCGSSPGNRTPAIAARKNRPRERAASPHSTAAHGNWRMIRKPAPAVTAAASGRRWAICWWSAATFPSASSLAASAAPACGRGCPPERLFPAHPPLSPAGAPSPTAANLPAAAQPAT